MEVSVKEEPKWQRVVEIVASHEDLQPEFEKAYKRYQKKVKLEGFRRGKVPLAMVKKLYARQIEADAIEQMLPDLFSRVRREHELRAVTPAQVRDLNYVPGGELKVTFSVEVEPEFELKKYENFKLERQVYDVSEEDVDLALKSVQEEHSVWETSSDPVGEQDYVVVDFQEVDAAGLPIIGQKFENQFFGVTKEDGEPSEIGRQLIGAAVGDSRLVQFTPEAQGDAPVEVKKLQANIREVKRRLLPDIDDELARDTGRFESLDEMKADMRDRIVRSMQKRLDESFHTSIIDEIIKNTKVELPEGMVNHYLDGFVERVQASAENGQVDAQQLRQQYRASAEWNLKWQLIRRKLLAAHELEVSTDDVQAYLREVSGVPEAEFKRSWNKIKNDADRMDSIRSELLEKKLLEFLAERQKIKEKKVSRKDLEKRQPAQA